MENIYYNVSIYDSCPCCGNSTMEQYDNFKSFSDARDFMLNAENRMLSAMLTTNDPIAKHYMTDDGSIHYIGD